MVIKRGSGFFHIYWKKTNLKLKILIYCEKKGDVILFPTVFFL